MEIVDDSMNKKHRVSFTLQDKCDIVQKLLAGKKQSDLCREQHLNRSTVATIWKNRHQILKAIDCNRNISTMKMRRSNYDQIDRALLDWYNRRMKEAAAGQQHTSSGISSAMLRFKAQELGRAFNYGYKFVCSDSWIDRFKKRHNIVGGRAIVVSDLAAASTTATFGGGVQHWLLADNDRCMLEIEQQDHQPIINEAEHENNEENNTNSSVDDPSSAVITIISDQCSDDNDGDNNNTCTDDDNMTVYQRQAVAVQKLDEIRCVLQSLQLINNNNNQSALQDILNNLTVVRAYVDGLDPGSPRKEKC